MLKVHALNEFAGHSQRLFVTVTFTSNYSKTSVDTFYYVSLNAYSFIVHVQRRLDHRYKIVS